MDDPDTCSVCGYPTTREVGLLRTAVSGRDGSDRIWCGRCHWKTTDTRGTPFYDSELASGEFLVAVILYTDTLPSINQIAGLLSPCYTTLHDQIRAVETAFCRGFPTVWERIS